MGSSQFFTELGEKLPLEVRLRVENLQCCWVEYRLPIRTQSVAGNANLECTFTHWPPPFAFLACLSSFLDPAAFWPAAVWPATLRVNASAFLLKSAIPSRKAFCMI